MTNSNTHTHTQMDLVTYCNMLQNISKISCIANRAKQHARTPETAAVTGYFWGI